MEIYSRNNKQYSKEFKKSVIWRLETPANESVPKISEELGIASSTIYQWVRVKINIKVLYLIANLQENGV